MSNLEPIATLPGQPEKFIIAENRYKQKLVLDPQDVIGKTILREGIYDRTGVSFIEKILSRLESPIVFDIGASIGNHALRMSQYSQMIYLFEPQRTLANHLVTTGALNQLENWKIFNLGLSDQNQALMLYRNLESNIETSFLPELKGTKFIEEEAAVRVGDEVVNENGIERLDFIKIDVEGFEAKVIAGLEKSINRFRPLIFMEWDKETTKRQFRELDLFNRIFSGYFIKALTRNPEEASLIGKLRGKMRRLFSKDKERKRWIIGEFNLRANYRHVVFIPREKIELVSEI